MPPEADAIRAYGIHSGSEVRRHQTGDWRDSSALEGACANPSRPDTIALERAERVAKRALRDRLEHPLT
jgi:hypothetical protein